MILTSGGVKLHWFLNTTSGWVIELNIIIGADVINAENRKIAAVRAGKSPSTGVTVTCSPCFRVCRACLCVSGCQVDVWVSNLNFFRWNIAFLYFAEYIYINLGRICELLWFTLILGIVFGVIWNFWSFYTYFDRFALERLLRCVRELI